MLRQKVLEGAAGWPEAEEAQPGALPLSEPLGVRTGAEDLELLANSFAGDIFHFLQEKKQIGKGVIGVHTSLTACCLLLSQE